MYFPYHRLVISDPDPYIWSLSHIIVLALREHDCKVKAYFSSLFEMEPVTCDSGHAERVLTYRENRGNHINCKKNKI